MQLLLPLLLVRLIWRGAAVAGLGRAQDMRARRERQERERL